MIPLKIILTTKHFLDLFFPFIAQKVFFCSLYACILLLMCVNNGSIVSFLQETPFSLCDAVHFCYFHFNVKKSSFSCEKEIYQLFMSCEACCGRGQDLERIFSSIPCVVLLLFPYNLFYF